MCVDECVQYMGLKFGNRTCSMLSIAQQMDPALLTHHLEVTWLLMGTPECHRRKATHFRIDEKQKNHSSLRDIWCSTQGESARTRPVVSEEWVCLLYINFMWGHQSSNMLFVFFLRSFIFFFWKMFYLKNWLDSVRFFLIVCVVISVDDILNVALLLLEQNPEGSLHIVQTSFLSFVRSEHIKRKRTF